MVIEVQEFLTIGAILFFDAKIKKAQSKSPTREWILSLISPVKSSKSSNSIESIPKCSLLLSILAIQTSF